ncbi:MAG TPA: M48 family metallopeptidase [Planctomycetota bacterium]|nr:M48 family metallopeptidase [Planctomycetota bacterium]
MDYARIVVIVFLVFFALEVILERALALLNVLHVKAHAARVPDALKNIVSEETYRKSIDYTLARARFGHVAAFEGAVLKLVFLFSGLLPWLSGFVQTHVKNEYLSGAAFLMLFGFIGAVASTPLDLYNTFEIEAKFGFNKTTFRTWLLDRVKAAALSVLIGVPFIVTLLWLTLRAGPLWWLWAALFMIGFQFLLMILYPLLIAPLFNKFTPLEEGELSRALKELAERCHFAARGIYVMDGSKRSAHSNAYFTGLGTARRIVLFDTLVAQLSVPELSAVLAHEIGHYKLKHIPKGLLLSCAMTLGGFFVLSLILHWPPLYAAFGWPVDFYSALGIAQGFLLCSLIAGPLTFWTKPLANALSRKFEYEADGFAKAQTGAEPMRGALLKLSEENLSNPTPHPLFSAYHYSHPSLLERLSALT